jgi:hypothetical protein
MKEDIIIKPSDSITKLQRASAHTRGRWWYTMPDNPSKALPLKRRGRYWEFKVPSITGFETQQEDMLYNALVDIHLCKATIYNSRK